MGDPSPPPTSRPATASDGDLALVERARAGDDRAKRELLTRMLPTMRAATRSLLGRGADADDACQQAAVDVLRGLASYRGEASPEAWARTIAVRAALRGATRQRRHVQLVDADALPGSATADRPRHDERLPRPLQAYLDALPPPQREALVLRHALGYSVPEIATLLETSVNTIKSRLLQARREVRRLIRRDQTTADIRRHREGS